MLLAAAMERELLLAPPEPGSPGPEGWKETAGEQVGAEERQKPGPRACVAGGEAPSPVRPAESALGEAVDVGDGLRVGDGISVGEDGG